MGRYILKSRVTSPIPRTECTLRFTRAWNQEPESSLKPAALSLSQDAEPLSTFALLSTSTAFSLQMASLGSTDVWYRMVTPQQWLQNPGHRASHVYTGRHSPGSLPKEERPSSDCIPTRAQSTVAGNSDHHKGEIYCTESGLWTVGAASWMHE